MALWSVRRNGIILVALTLAVVLIVACGTATQSEQAQSGGEASTAMQETAQQPAQAQAEPAAASSASGSTNSAPPAAMPGGTPIPTAVPAAAQPTPAAMTAKPEGALVVGQKELGPFMGHPLLAGNPQIFVQGTAPIGESLLTVSSDLEPVGMLAQSWEVSEDALTWTFTLTRA